MRDRAGGRRAAKGAGGEVGMRAGMLMHERAGMLMNMRGGRSLQPDGTQFQGERYAAGRHETDRNIGAENEQRQQPKSGRATTPTIEDRLGHQGRREYTITSAQVRKFQRRTGLGDVKPLGETNP